CYISWPCDSGMLINPDALCDGYVDCDDETDEVYCDGDYFVCDGGTLFISVDKVCDDDVDCEDGTDEDYCEYAFYCDELFAVFPELVCDGRVDCDGGWDEAFCY